MALKKEVMVAHLRTYRGKYLKRAKISNQKHGYLLTATKEFNKETFTLFVLIDGS